MSQYKKSTQEAFKSYEKYEYVRGRLIEARRLAKRVKSRKPLVMPYVWYLYQDSKEFFSVVIFFVFIINFFLFFYV